MFCRLFLLRALSIVALVLVASPTVASEGQDPVGVEVGRWLHLDAVDLPSPALAEEELPDGLEALERMTWPLDELRPEKGAHLQWSPGESSPWRVRSSRDGRLDLGEVDTARTTLAATYVEAGRFLEIELVLRTAHRGRLFVDGEQVLAKESSDAADAETTGEESAKTSLTRGQHLIVAELLADPGVETDWSVGLTLMLDAAQSGALEFDLDPRHHLSLDDLLDAETVSSVEISPDGAVVALSLHTPQPPSEDRRSWIDFYDADSGEILRSLKGIGDLGAFAWEPGGDRHRYAFVTREDGAASLWVADLEGGQPTVVLEDRADFGSFRWIPEGEGIVFSQSEEGDKDPDHFKRYRGLTDRWQNGRSRSYLYLCSVPDGVVRRLTAGEHTTSLEDISRDGETLLFSRTIYVDDEWPFSRTELHELDLLTLETRLVTEAPWGLSALYTPKRDQALILSSPLAFDELGEDVPEDVLANLYDGQAYLLDLESKQPTPISRDFDPAIGSAVVSFADDRIYARVTDRSFDSIYRYDLDDDEWEEVPTELESVTRFGVAANGSRLVYQGTSSSVPSRVYTLSLRGSGRSELLCVQGPERVADIRFGEVEDYDVEVETGEFKGRVYYPPDFDSSGSYPAIVYYYGGTVPVTRSYGGRYPKELWASHGYVVYVLQPSGATGFGQEFSARHVNNWGRTVADEIIEATGQFLSDHDFVDPARVGCIGASYGGFMTMLLTTRTDIFAGAVSHAGISSLSSYWGEGDWGYSYSAGATALSYPWNAPDLYLEQSPLFAADRVNTPILLLHGGIDNNVPPGESEQFYTALRVLGKEVEYVRIEGERHWILTYDKRRLWAQSIVAWFDRTLKGDPSWWNHLYDIDAED